MHSIFNWFLDDSQTKEPSEYHTNRDCPLMTFSQWEQNKQTKIIIMYSFHTVLTYHFFYCIFFIEESQVWLSIFRKETNDNITNNEIVTSFTGLQSMYIYTEIQDVPRKSQWSGPALVYSVGYSGTGEQVAIPCLSPPNSQSGSKEGREG